MVLCAANDYFAAFLSNDQLKDDQVEITIENVDWKTLFDIIQFCYTGDIEINESSINSILSAAEMLQFVKLKEKCAEFYKTILKLDNCLGIEALAKQYNIRSLQKLASSMALEQLKETCQTKEFQHLEVEQLTDLLNNEYLIIDSEEDVFNAVVKWVEFDLENRKLFVETLLQTVRVGLIDYSVSIALSKIEK